MKKRPAMSRFGAAAVELALMLPLLLVLFIVSVDFARIYYVTQVVTDCARRGAAYGANPDVADRSSYESIEEAALAASEGVDSPPVIAVTEQLDAGGNRCISVTATHSFSLISGFLGNQSTWTVSRTAYARCTKSDFVD
jgi:Flp pilus assembly protein TadG